MVTSPFLTDLDSRAAVKGSRDPLGIQPIWTRLGRHVVGNLTTVSNSVRDFTTLLLGYYFARQLADELGSGSELATFLKWEQLAAYARASINKDVVFRGTERVRKTLSDGSRITLSDDRSYQILSNQKIYGLWGLYTMASRASGLVEGDPAQLTPPALDLVEHLYLPMMVDGAGSNGRHILDLLRPRSSRLDIEGSGKRLIEVIAQVLKRRLLAGEREFYRFHLLYGGPVDETQGRQQQFAELLKPTLSQKDFTWSTGMVGSLAKTARSRGEEWNPLADRLERIRTSEAVLGPVSLLFTHLLGLDGKSMDVVAKRIREAWGPGLRTVDPEAFRELCAEIGDGDPTTGQRWVDIARAAAKGDYGSLLELLVAQNKSVMDARGGAPWLETRQGRLQVRFRDEQGVLPRREDIASVWRFPYFLDSVRSVAAAVQEP